MDREHQLENFRRRLTPPPKEPEGPHLIGRVLNSPFTLWLLTVVFVSVGGAYFTGHQKCEADAGRLISGYYKEQIELMRRLEYIRTGVARAKDIEDVRRVMGTQPFVYDDLKNRTTRDITYELRITERLIDFTKDARFIARYRAVELPPLRFSPEDFGRYNGLSVGEWPSVELTNDDLDAAKNVVNILVSHEMAGLSIHNLVRLWPRCNFINSISGVPMRGPRKVIEADTSISANDPLTVP